MPRAWSWRHSPPSPPSGCWRWVPARARLAEQIARAGRRGGRGRPVGAHGRADAFARDRGVGGGRPEAAVRRRRVRCRRSRLDALPRARCRPGDRRAIPRVASGWPPGGGDEQRREPHRAVVARRRGPQDRLRLRPGERRGDPGPPIRARRAAGRGRRGDVPRLGIRTAHVAASPTRGSRPTVCRGSAGRSSPAAASVCSSPRDDEAERPGHRRPRVRERSRPRCAPRGVCQR